MARWRAGKLIPCFFYFSVINSIYSNKVSGKFFGRFLAGFSKKTVGYWSIFIDIG